MSTYQQQNVLQDPIEALDIPPELSVVLPCLNEAETLADCIEQVRCTLHAFDIDGEIIVADNGSSDGSQQIAAMLGVRVVHIRERGYGAALIGGIGSARGNYVVMADADMSYNFADIPALLAKLRRGSDLVMGNRFLGGIAKGAMPPLHRYLGNPVLTALGRLFFKSPCGDFHCGLRGFSKDAFERMDLRCTGMEFASEMIVKATVLGMKIEEVATTLSPDGRSRAPHLRTWRDGWRHLRFLLMYSPRWLFLYPGVLMMTVGLLVGFWLLPGPRHLGHITIDFHTLLYAALAIIVGYQAIIFAISSKLFAVSQGLLPNASWLKNILRVFTLERGVISGIVLTLAGLGLAVYSVLNWGQQRFGNLDPGHMVRIVACVIALITMGVQTIFASFFLEILGLSRKDDEGRG